MKHSFSSLWGRITGSDRKLRYPEQQYSALGRIGNGTVIFPYGLFTDLPNNTLLRQLANGVVIPVTVKRPSDTAVGEPVFFHPETNTRIVARNDGSLDIYTQNNASPVNIFCSVATVNGDAVVTGDTRIDGNLDVVGDITARFGTAGAVGLATHTHAQGNDSNGDAEVDTNPPSAGT